MARMLSRPSRSIVRPCARRSQPSAAEAISISDEHTGVGTPSAAPSDSSRPSPCGMHKTVTENGMKKTALIVVGGCLGGEYLRSLLYHPDFTTEYRKGKA